jgi:hypothetical protein
MSAAHSHANRPAEPPPRRTGPAADTGLAGSSGAAQPTASVLTREILAPAIVVVLGAIMTILPGRLPGPPDPRSHPRHPGGWKLAAIHLSFIAGTPGAPPIPGANGRAARENSPNRPPVKEA